MQRYLDDGTSASRLHRVTLALGTDAMYPWAYTDGVTWDFQQYWSWGDPILALDCDAPINSQLSIDFVRTEFANYP